MNATTLAIIAMKQNENMPSGTLSRKVEGYSCDSCGGTGVLPGEQLGEPERTCPACSGLGLDNTRVKPKGPLSGYSGIRKTWIK